ncbi:MAG TPA: hypothetical protein ENJ82_14225 [Bacteroidetes bacterium]|nr:hypothetical protein [Bacteroidota bacterium]
MDILESIIVSLSSDEVRRFKILSNRFKADDEKKVLILFDAIRCQKYAKDDSALVKLLYAGNSPKTRNRYYRLRNKLVDNIEKSLIFYHFKYKDSIHAYYDIQLAIMFRERDQFRLSLYFLKKAEKKAKALNQFDVLEQIYEEFTRLAEKDIEIEIEKLLEKRRKNLAVVNQERQNTEVIALITQRLMKFDFARSNASVLALLAEVKAGQGDNANVFSSLRGRIQIFETVRVLLLKKGAFVQFVSFLDHTIADFETNELFTQETHAIRLTMRLNLITSLIKVYDFARASEEIRTFEKEMKLFAQQNYFTFLIDYYKTKIELLKYQGQSAKVEKVIKEALAKPEIRRVGTNVCFLLRSLADQQFNKQRYQDAVGTLARLKAESDYKLLADEVRLFIEIFELIVHLEASDFQFTHHHLKPLRKSFRTLLKTDKMAFARKFLDILARINNAEINQRKVSLRVIYKNFKPLVRKFEFGDDNIVMYDLILLSKLEKKPYYELFIHEMQART